MERSRRAVKQKAPASKFAELKAARAGGKSRLEQYNPDENNALYDEIDEADYQRAKLQDDFVVDDGAEGYVDNGMDEFEREHRYYSSEEDEQDGDRRRGRKGKKKGTKENDVKVTEGAIDRLFRKPALQMAKKTAISTEEDADFMASILGELDETVTSSSRNLKRDRQTTAVVHPNKKRYSSPSPPLRVSSAANRQPVAQPIHVKTEVPSSPPLANLTLDSEDGRFMDIDNEPSFITAPSSPPAKPLNGTKGINSMDLDSEDELPVVKKLSAAKPATTNKSVNISASKPAPPAPKIEVKKEPSPAPEVPNATWRDLDSTLNVTAAPTGSSPGRVVPADVLETLTMTVKEMVEQEDGSEIEVEKSVEKPVVNVFWLDYGEFNGVLGLFGKVFNKKTQQWISCFVKVEGLERCLYFLPRENHKGSYEEEYANEDTNEEVTMEQVYNEVNEILLKHRITEFRNRPVAKKYAFELNDVPRECDYLEVLYPFSSTSLTDTANEEPQLPFDLQGKTFSRVFGAWTGIFERFVLERKIMGPCWLQIVDPDFSKAQNVNLA
jgi:DNA polymerase alpha subunit A